MIDKKQVMFDIERCICHVPDACKDCSKYKGIDGLRCMEELMADAHTLLKEQEPVKSEWRNGKAFCGKCGKPFPRNRGEQRRFCSYCGQEIKWGV